ncbi:MAG TPA: cytochrome P460 family protein [Steroidobacteraceae bacterium]|nr:cytochrome P460 family protein [Steroidobacteraceae bacterium]
MKHALTASLLATVVIAGWSVGSAADRKSAYPHVDFGPQFDAKGDLELPKGFRRWVFIGSPLTPHGLNDGAAGFPEFHNVYVEPAAYDYYVEHGEWPEGTMMVKELQLTKSGTFDDGSRTEASGRGYFPGVPNGMDVSVKDSKRFAATNGWGFFNFGHHAPPYAATASDAPVEACAGCHIANAHEDMVFTEFYQQLKPLPATARR